jgi:hypothetical protein
VSGLSDDYKERKETPICTGVLDYFPDAVAEVAKVSLAGNLQHKLGPPLRWDKSKSRDERDAAVRHLMAKDAVDTDGHYHAAKAAWRVLAFLQKAIEAKREGLTYDEYDKKLASTTTLNNPAAGQVVHVSGNPSDYVFINNRPYKKSHQAEPDATGYSSPPELDEV